MPRDSKLKGAEEQWSKLVSAKRPVSFEGSAGILEVRACCLASTSSGPSALYCSVPGHPQLALGRVSDEAPHCRILGLFREDVTFSCEGGDIQLLGLHRPQEGGSSGERPAKVARTEVSKDAAAAASAAAPAASAASPAAAKPAPAPAAAKPAAAAPAAPAAAPAKGATSATPAPKAAPEAAAKAEAQPLSKSAKKRMRKEAAKAAAAAASPSGAQPSAAAAAPKPAAAPKQAEPAAEAGKDGKSGPALTRNRLPSGLQFEVLKAGRGPEQAASGKTVQVRYEGRLAKTGQRFDKGVIKFRLGMGEVIRGWDEGVKGMMKGERRRLLVPSRLGYGHQGAPPAIPRNADLVFEVELVGC